MSPPAPVPAIPRIDWVDAAKGLAIVLVVYGHVYPPGVGIDLHLLRMPLFLFLAGYVFKPRPMADFVWKRGNSLIVPYAVYLVALTLLFWVAPLALGLRPPLDGAHAAASPLAGRLYGGTHLPGPLYPMWFLPVLFAALAMINGLLRRFGSATDARTIVAVAGLAAIGFALAGVRTPLCLGVAPVALFFVWAGNAYRRVVLPAWTAAPAVLLVAAAAWQGRVFDLMWARYGVPGFTCLAALAACHLAVIACRALTRSTAFNAIFTRLGQASLVVLVLHQPVDLYLQMHTGLPRLAILPLAVAIPFLCFLLLRRTGPIGHWLLLGEPPPRPALRATLARST